MGTEFMNLQFDDLQFNYIISYQYSITTHSHILQFYTVIFSLYLIALPNIHTRHPYRDISRNYEKHTLNNTRPSSFLIIIK